MTFYRRNFIKMFYKQELLNLFSFFSLEKFKIISVVVGGEWQKIAFNFFYFIVASFIVMAFWGSIHQSFLDFWSFFNKILEIEMFEN